MAQLSQGCSSSGAGGAQGAMWALWEHRELAEGLGEVIHESGSEEGTVLSSGENQEQHCSVTVRLGGGMLCAEGQSQRGGVERRGVLPPTPRSSLQEGRIWGEAGGEQRCATALTSDDHRQPLPGGVPRHGLHSSSNPAAQHSECPPTCPGPGGGTEPPHLPASLRGAACSQTHLSSP